MTEIPAPLSIVTLAVRDVNGRGLFYRGQGWPELPVGDDSWTGFLVGGVRPALFPMNEVTEEAAPGGPRPTGWAVTLFSNVGARQEVDTAFDPAAAAGTTPIGAATDRPWGGRFAFVADPEGNRGEITWLPRAAYDARGALPSRA